MQLALATWHEVEDYLRSSRGIIIPIGSTEQHGPNGLIGTDHLDAEFVSKGVGDSVGCLVAPTLTIGMSQHHMAFTGSITLRPTTLIARGERRRQFADPAWVRAVPVHQRPWRQHRPGEHRVLGDLRRCVDPWADRHLAGALQDGDVGGRAAGRKLTKELYGDSEGSHATASEVSLSQFYQPQHIKHAQMSPKVAPRSPVFYDSADYRRRFPDGRIGSDPSLSSPEHGEQIYQAAVEDMVEVYQKFVAD